MNGLDSVNWKAADDHVSVGRKSYAEEIAELDHWAQIFARIELACRSELREAEAFVVEELVA